MQLEKGLETSPGSLYSSSLVGTVSYCQFSQLFYMCQIFHYTLENKDTYVGAQSTYSVKASNVQTNPFI